MVAVVGLDGPLGKSMSASGLPLELNGILFTVPPQFELGYYGLIPVIPGIWNPLVSPPGVNQTNHGFYGPHEQIGGGLGGGSGGRPDLPDQGNPPPGGPL